MIKKYWASGALALTSISYGQTPPSWWITRGVLSGQADDYAAANIGQLKFVAAKASIELNAQLSGGAGTAITAMVTDWGNAPASGVVRDDYAVLTLGQLKAVSAMFYDRLAQYGYTGGPLIGLNRYPWTGGSADDYAVANLGQVKYVFSFFAVGYSFNAARADWDLDYLPDVWETAYGLSTAANDTAGDGDGDGLNNLTEYKIGTNPIFRDTTALGLEVYTP